MKNLFILSLLVIFFSCGHAPSDDQENTTNSTANNNTTKNHATGSSKGCYFDICNEWDVEINEKPKMLVIGDSISIGYTPYLEYDHSEYQVLHNPGNGRSSSYGVVNIEYWVNLVEKWEVCTINHGIWDMLKDHLPMFATTEDQYRANLNYEISILKSRCEKIIVPNITYIPENVWYVDYSKIDDFNIAIEEVAVENGLIVCDLNSLSRSITHLYDYVEEIGDDVHFTKDGYQELANELSQCINDLK